jgi:hypothetical protein
LRKPLKGKSKLILKSQILPLGVSHEATFSVSLAKAREAKNKNKGKGELTLKIKFLIKNNNH